MIWTILPAVPAVEGRSSVSVMLSLLPVYYVARYIVERSSTRVSRSAGLAQRLGTAGDLEDLLGDAGLPGLVVGQRQRLNDVLGVLRRVVHRDHARGVLARERLEQRLV